MVTGPEISPISRDRLAGALRAAELRGLRGRAARRDRRLFRGVGVRGHATRCSPPG
ncbi:hypothetical protein QP185_07935 [Sphingomonas aerolata]|uniref:hypothetical protein n=1 Tax=Sphingomonas aerolata TaxID=185951 RepID=UPI002FE3B51E